MSQADSAVAELSISDHAQLASLEEYLRLALPEVRVTRGVGHARVGELGVLDVLMIAADSSVLVAVVKVLPEFLRSRRREVTVTITVKGKRKELTVTAEDPEHVRRAVEKFFDE